MSGAIILLIDLLWCPKSASIPGASLAILLASAPMYVWMGQREANSNPPPGMVTWIG